ncbi:putative ACT domain-containing protein ACR1-12 [Helianthus annuus]|uniref:ACT domain-containing protein ACR1-12 n=1 Tax=Helianthus annuus TaxID=4232 RepID=A0A251T296_HELAN|nr:putative ACT domain-containing protein ACR1-12 [Helianthus annuus]KAJ0489547.1 putative ACT domain-containing protein ACR1-12 [Helianthus annuus]KAJ0493419.1 putative ACT domain-containing protein ACR1-12 [Helianthus annuus]KAJ0505456.1 putative ACT domain-containing protein ACR1-12 [Helianthus annuus]KAJ0675130.1 putative ACT domain-containing protein ACR1-12 [Helianthus annuus]
MYVNDSLVDDICSSVDNVNRHGILLELVQVLSDPNFIFTEAYISSDGGWCMDGIYFSF